MHVNLLLIFRSFRVRDYDGGEPQRLFLVCDYFLQLKTLIISLCGGWSGFLSTRTETSTSREKAMLVGFGFSRVGAFVFKNWQP